MRFVTGLLQWVQDLCLATWLGGILVLGAIGAPAGFRAAREAGDSQRGTPLFDFAGTVAQGMFTRFNTLALVAGALLLVVGIAHGLRSGLCRRRLGAWAALVGIAWAISLWMAFSLFPEMAAVRGSGPQEAFDHLHHTSSLAFRLQALLLATAAALTTWMRLDVNRK
jgi:hypothetical protein